MELAERKEKLLKEYERAIQEKVSHEQRLNYLNSFILESQGAIKVLEELIKEAENGD